MATIKDITSVILYIAVIGLVGCLAAACLAGCTEKQGSPGDAGMWTVVFWQESGSWSTQLMS